MVPFALRFNIMSLVPTVIILRLIPGVVIVYDSGPLLPAEATTVIPSSHRELTAFTKRHSDGYIDNFYVVEFVIFQNPVYSLNKSMCGRCSVVGENFDGNKPGIRCHTAQGIAIGSNNSADMSSM